MSLGRIFIVVFLILLPIDTLAQTIDQLQKTIASTADPAEQSKLYKQLGDAFVAQDNLEQAAGAFSKALALGRDRFTARERVQMAIYLSWADRLQESKDELNRVINQDAKNIAARTHLARVHAHGHSYLLLGLSSHKVAPGSARVIATCHSHSRNHF